MHIRSYLPFLASEKRLLDQSTPIYFGWVESTERLSETHSKTIYYNPSFALKWHGSYQSVYKGTLKKFLILLLEATGLPSTLLKVSSSQLRQGGATWHIQLIVP